MTELEAHDAFFGIIRTAWTGKAATVTGSSTDPVIYWQGAENDGPPSIALAWARALVLHQAGGQSSLAGSAGTIRWSRSGLVIVQCFAPLSSGRALAISTGLARLITTAFQAASSDSGAQFTQICLLPVGRDNAWYQVNAKASFEYGEWA